MGHQYKVLLSADQIKERVQELGNEISAHYKNKGAKSLVVVGVLKGSFIFLADLVRTLSIGCEIDFVEASSYGASTISSGEVKLLRDVSVPIENRDVLFVEDIVDTGHTMTYLFKHIKSHNPRSVAVCALLDKPSRRKVKMSVDFTGFTIEDHFVVGYGLDFNNKLREIDSVVIYQE